MTHLIGKYPRKLLLRQCSDPGLCSPSSATCKGSYLWIFVLKATRDYFDAGVPRSANPRLLERRRQLCESFLHCHWQTRCIHSRYLRSIGKQHILSSKVSITGFQWHRAMKHLQLSNSRTSCTTRTLMFRFSLLL